MLTKIISGGQTGVDRGALDAAIALGIPHGGWCPKGRRAEDGRIPDRYELIETPSADYPQRTEWNARDADMTLILMSAPGQLTGGTLLTLSVCKRLGGRSLLSIVMNQPPHDAAFVRDVIEQFEVSVLNIAGPRESKCRGIQAATTAFLLDVLRCTSGIDRCQLRAGHVSAHWHRHQDGTTDEWQDITPPSPAPAAPAP